MFTTQNHSRLGSQLMLAVSALGLFWISACQPGTNSNANVNANANLNANTQPANTNSSSANPATNSAAESANIVKTREPDKYSATLMFSVETQGGDKAIGIPPLSLQVARNGADRRVEFRLPDGNPLIYLDHDNHHYVILPARKQYAELSQEATGVQLHKLLTPGQLVEDLKNVKGVELVGDEPLNGRPAEKYRYSRTTNTNTKAGEVKAEAFIYVDKETGLPLRSELDAESSGDVKGVKAARVVAEMRDIKTDITGTLFDLPKDFSQVPPEKLRQQIDALTSAIATVLKSMMSSSQAPPPPPASPK